LENPITGWYLKEKLMVSWIKTRSADLRGANLASANLARANLIGAHVSLEHLQRLKSLQGAASPKVFPSRLIQKLIRTIKNKQWDLIVQNIHFVANYFYSSKDKTALDPKAHP
jgi:hypothetical protein